VRRLAYIDSPNVTKSSVMPQTAEC